MKVWVLEYKISEDVTRATGDALNLLRHRFHTLRYDPHVEQVDLRTMIDPSCRQQINIMTVRFKDGYTQPQNPELWHLDILLGASVPTWYERIVNNDFFDPV